MRNLNLITLIYLRVPEKINTFTSAKSNACTKKLNVGLLLPGLYL